MKTRLMSQNTPLHKLRIEFFINRNHVNRQHEERDEPNHGVGRPIATAGLGVPSGLFNDFGDVVFSELFKQRITASIGGNLMADSRPDETGQP